MNFNRLLESKISKFNQSKTYSDAELNSDNLNRLQIENLVEINYSIYLERRKKQFIVSIFMKTAATACLTTLLLLCGVFYRMWKVTEETFESLKIKTTEIRLRRRKIRKRVLLPM